MLKTSNKVSPEAFVRIFDHDLTFHIRPWKINLRLAITLLICVQIFHVPCEERSSPSPKAAWLITNEFQYIELHATLREFTLCTLFTGLNPALRQAR